MNRDAGCVGTHNRASLAHRLDAFQYAFLDLQILSHSFDNPVGLRQTGEVIIEIPQTNQLAAFRSKESGRFVSPGALQTLVHDAIANLWVSQSETFGLFVTSQFRRSHIQEVYWESRVRE